MCGFQAFADFRESTVLAFSVDILKLSSSYSELSLPSVNIIDGEVYAKHFLDTLIHVLAANQSAA